MNTGMKIVTGCALVGTLIIGGEFAWLHHERNDPGKPLPARDGSQHR